MHYGSNVVPSTDGASAAAHWDRVLHDLTALTPLPHASGDPQACDGERATAEVPLSSALVEAWAAFDAGHGVSPRALLHAAWALLLARSSRERDVVFAIDTRSGPAPLRATFDGDRRVDDLVAALDLAATEAERHAAHPPSSILWESGVGAGADLALSLDRPAPARLRLEGAATRFSAAALTAILMRVACLLDGMLADPHAPLDEVPWMPEAERRQVIDDFNETTRPFPEVCLHDLFTDQVRRTPTAPAIVAGHRQWSYAELARRATAVARHLRALGVGPDVPVPICVERSPEMIAGALGVLLAGGAYVPLDAAWPTPRLLYMLESSAAPVLLTERRMAPRFEGSGARVVTLDDFDFEAGDGELPAAATSPHHLAYVIYTSGSTGQPKGVAMVHRAAVNLMAWQNRVAAVGPGARTMQFVSLSFDVSVQEIFATLTSGGTLVLISEAERHDPVRMWRLLDEMRIERLILPFTALHQLAAAAAMSAETPRFLREVINCGEQLRITPAIVSLFERLPACRLHNHYGPTEACVVMIVHPLPDDPHTWPALPVIGRPIDNTRAYVLDERRRPVPPGVPGELYIGGECLARGYLGRPDLTDERFVPDPFSARDGARMYRSGDLVRLRDDGEIEFLGRLDNQVKIHGFRVELGEIEAALGRHPAVREGVVAVREDRPGERRLVAYVVPRAGGLPDLADLRAFLGRDLAAYMLPTALVILERFPLTPGGKTDRKALPPPAPSRPPGAPPFVAPREGHERVLAGIWEDVLDVRPVGATDPFVDLGGKSVHLIEICTRIRQAMHVDIDVTEVFQRPTVRALASALDTSAPTAVSRALERARRQRAALGRRD